MRAVKYFGALLSVQFFILATALASPCDQFKDSAGNILPIEVLEEKELLVPGVWVTDDINEYRAFPKNVKKAILTYTRKTKSRVKEFTENLGTVRELGNSTNIRTGYLVGVDIYSADTSSLPSFSGAAYDLTSGKAVLLFEVVNDKVFCQ